jgi:ribosomal protein L1
MSIREKIRVEVRRKIVEITIFPANEDELKVLNAYIDRILSAEEEAENIKWYRNRVDYFIVMPQTDWQPQEMAMLLKRLLNL